MKINPKNISSEAFEFLKEIECFYEVPTKINGVLYTGYGFNFYENGDSITQNDLPLSKKYASRYLRNLLKPYEACVGSAIDIRISQSQFDALVLLCYDIGIKNFLRASLIRRINLSDDPKDLYHYWMESQYEHKFNEEMARMREVEYHLYTTSEINPNL
jgi:GH24 family phage-related lysozyme (muramidase)